MMVSGWYSYPGGLVHLLADLDHDWFPPGHHSHQVEQVGRTRVEQHLHEQLISNKEV